MGEKNFFSKIKKATHVGKCLLSYCQLLAVNKPFT